MVNSRFIIMLSVWTLVLPKEAKTDIDIETITFPCAFFCVAMYTHVQAQPLNIQIDLTIPMNIRC